MNPALPKELVLIVAFVVANVLIAAPVIRFFARSLTLKRALELSFQAFVPTSIGLIAYFIAKMQWGFTGRYDGLATVVAMCVAGIIITASAERKYGVVKEGWVGIGGKTSLTLITLSWLFFAINLTTHIFF